MLRARGRALAICTLLLATGGVAYAEGFPPAPVVISLRSRDRVRVQIAEGTTMPCDTLGNRMIFDGTLGANEVFQTTILGSCICIRNTTDAFPRAGWSLSGLACRKWICRGRRCWPDPDPTIRVALDATQ